MKKTILLSIFTSITFTIFYTQDSILKYKNKISIEGQIYPNFNQDIYKPKIKIRYNLNQKSALRINTNFTRLVD